MTNHALANPLKELTPQQSLFLASLLELGGGPRHAGDAAWNAGYGESREEAERAGRILLESPKIIKALKNAIAHRFDVAAGAACETLVEICTDKKTPARARISAAQEILNRAPSHGPVASRSMHISAQTTVEDFLARLDAEEKETASGQARGAEARVIEGTAIDVTPAVECEGDVSDE